MLKILLACATLFESKKLILANELVRKTFGPMLIVFLKVTCGGKWVLRHSATVVGQYNIFFSDYDLALLIDESWSDQDLFLALAKFNKIKRILIMLGEVEVYFRNEWIEKQDLISEHGPVVMQVRDLRKFKWMKDRFRLSNVPYHKAKAIRSIKTCRRKIRNRKTEIQKILNVVFEGVPVPFKNRYSDFFQTEIFFSEANSNQLLMALSTVDRSPYLPWSTMILQIRHPVLRFEELEHRAYQRERQSKIIPIVEWLEKLNTEIKSLELIHKTDPTWIKRFNLHINSKWVNPKDIIEIRQQEEELKAVECLEEDRLFQAWLKINIPKVFVFRIAEKTTTRIQRLQEPFQLDFEQKRKDLFLNTKPENVCVLSYFGPTSFRFGFDLFILFVLFLEELNNQKYLIEICSCSMAREIIEEDPMLYGEFLKIKSEVVFLKKVTGKIIQFYRNQYPLERNWIAAAEAFDERLLN